MWKRSGKLVWHSWRGSKKQLSFQYAKMNEITEWIHAMAYPRIYTHGDPVLLSQNVRLCLIKGVEVPRVTAHRLDAPGNAMPGVG